MERLLTLAAAASPDRSLGGRLARRAMQVVAVAWLGALIQPLSALGQAHLPPLQRGVTIAATAVFVATYLWVTWGVTRHRPAPPTGGGLRPATVWLPVAILTVLSVVFTLVYGGAWPELFIFTGVSAGFRLPTPKAAWTIGGLVLLGTASAFASALIAAPTLGPSGSAADLVRLALLIGSPGFAIMTVVHSVTTVRELRAARAEIARLAVAEERLRFARDLHDLLGRSLSLIALKSELAGQLVPVAPEQATAEIRDVESVARTALQEVRDAVAGYRQPTLDAELRAAREILAAAGIGFSHDDPPSALPRPIEAVLAWAVREGVTNVIRHSRARYCSVRLSTGAGRAAVIVTDDGADRNPGEGAGDGRLDVAHGTAGRTAGHGLAGLAERVAALGGDCQAGQQAGGGFRLAVSLPVAAGSAADTTLEGVEPAYESQRP